MEDTRGNKHIAALVKLGDDIKAVVVSIHEKPKKDLEKVVDSIAFIANDKERELVDLEQGSKDSEHEDFHGRPRIERVDDVLKARRVRHTTEGQALAEEHCTHMHKRQHERKEEEDGLQETRAECVRVLAALGKGDTDIDERVVVDGLEVSPFEDKANSTLELKPVKARREERRRE
jgi:hypothetical protein